MDALETLVKTVSGVGASLTEDARVRTVRAASQDMENPEAVLIVAKEEAGKLKEIPDPTPEQVARMRSLVDVVAALTPEPEPAAPQDEEPPIFEADSQQHPVGSSELVNASNSDLVSLSAIRSHAPVSQATAVKPRYSAFAAADLPDMAAGAEFTSEKQMGQAVANRMRALAATQSKSTAGLMVYQANSHPDIPTVGPHSNESELAALFADISNPNRLTKGSDGTFANAGFCSPSMIDYSFCPLPTSAGMVDLPSINVERGGIRFPIMPSLESMWNVEGACYTEAEAMALEDDKPCYEIPCPTFVDYRGSVCHACAINSLLTEYAYPELVQNVVATALVLFEHRMNAKILADMVKNSTAVPAAAVVADTYGPKAAATATMLDSASLAAEQLRTAHMLELNAVMEVVLPAWARPLMKSDLAKRNGIDLLAVTDQDIDRYFAARNIRIQWVRDWQSAPASGKNTDIGGSKWGSAAANPYAWPKQVQMIVFPAGRFLLARDEIIRITGQYDHDLLVQNKALALFLEQFYLLVPRCYSSYVVTVDVCANGVTGEQAAITCPAI